MAPPALRLIAPPRGPRLASRRRGASVSRARRLPSCSVRTRFSSRREAITSSWWRFTQPAKPTSRIRQRTLSTMRRVYRQPIIPPVRATSAEFSDSTAAQALSFLFRFHAHTGAAQNIRGCNVFENTDTPLMSRRSTVISVLCASMFTSPKNCNPLKGDRLD